MVVGANQPNTSNTLAISDTNFHFVRLFVDTLSWTGVNRKRSFVVFHLRPKALVYCLDSDRVIDSIGFLNDGST